MATPAEPGWYPDPTRVHEQRYFDGDNWTEHVTDNGVPGTDAYREPFAAPEAPEAPQVTTWPPVAATAPPPAQPTSPGPQPTPPAKGGGFPTWAKIAAGAVGVLVVLVVIGAIVGSDNKSDKNTKNASAPSTTTPSSSTTAASTATTPAQPVLEEADLEIDAPATVSASTDSVTIKGTTNPGARVKVASPHGSRSTIADSKGRWTIEVSPKTGENDYQVTASGDDLKETSDYVSVTRKKEPPHVGSTQTAEGFDTTLAVKVNGVLDPLPTGEFDQPEAGMRYVGIEITVKNTGNTPFSDSPGNGSEILTSDHRQYDSTIVASGPCGSDFQSDLKLRPGDTRTGCIPFEVPADADLSAFQFTMDSGFADDTNEWDLTQ